MQNTAQIIEDFTKIYYALSLTFNAKTARQITTRLARKLRKKKN